MHFIEILYKCINPFSAERRYIVAHALEPYYTHYERSVSQNNFIKRYKWFKFVVTQLKKFALFVVGRMVGLREDHAQFVMISIKGYTVYASVSINAK